MSELTSKKPVIGVDFDDVLFKCNEALADFHNRLYSTSYSVGDVTTFDLSSVWNCTPEEAEERFEHFFKSTFHHETEMVFGAKAALETLNETYDIVIVTARPSASKDATLEWLSRHFLGLYKEIHFTNQFHKDRSLHRLKSSVLKDVGAVAFIEDALHHAEDASMLGIPVFLFDAPWNQGDVPKGVTRVYSWEEVLQGVSSLSLGTIY